MSLDVTYMHYLNDVVTDDTNHLRLKEKSYGDSWKKRGGIGAFMMLARKWDRIENLLDKQTPKYDVFKGIEYNTSGEDSTILAEIRDLRRYLILVEAEMMARGNVARPAMVITNHTIPLGGGVGLGPGTPEDGGHHEKMVTNHINVRSGTR